jgi:hypothetical protein
VTKKEKKHRNEHGIATVAFFEDWSGWRWESDDEIDLDAIKERAGDLVLKYLRDDASIELDVRDERVDVDFVSMDCELILSCRFDDMIESFLGSGYCEEDRLLVITALEKALERVRGCTGLAA